MAEFELKLYVTGKTPRSEHAIAALKRITDSIILLRYVEMFGEMRRGLTVLKMRGSAHDKDIREFTIDGQGMHIGKAFRGIAGILSGNPIHIPGNEIERVGGMFAEAAIER